MQNMELSCSAQERKHVKGALLGIEDVNLESSYISLGSPKDHIAKSTPLWTWAM